jgi:hypothetical protein
MSPEALGAHSVVTAAALDLSVNTYEALGALDGSQSLRSSLALLAAVLAS